MIVKKAYCFDFDETLVKTKSRIHVYRNGAFYKSLTSKEFNFFEPGPYDTFDFSEFKDGELILNAKKYKMWPVLEKISDAIKENKTDSTIFILTGRSTAVKSFIYEYLKNNGIDIDFKHIITIGDDAGKISISEEKKKVLNQLAQKYNEIVFFDDDPKNIALAAGIHGIKTRLVEGELNENDYADLSLKDLMKLRNQYQKMFKEMETPPKRPKRDIRGNEIKRNSTPLHNLKKEYKIIVKMIAKKFFDQHNKGKLVYEDMGGVSAPMSTLSNTPGMGNVVPPVKGGTGSGDSWGNKLNKKPYTQAKSLRKKKKVTKPLEEENINPYDKIGMAMAKKMKVKTPFKKKPMAKNQNSMEQRKFEHQIITLNEFIQKLNEDK